VVGRNHLYIPRAHVASLLRPLTQQQVLQQQVLQQQVLQHLASFLGPLTQQQAVQQQVLQQQVRQQQQQMHQEQHQMHQQQLRKSVHAVPHRFANMCGNMLEIPLQPSGHSHPHIK